MDPKKPSGLIPNGTDSTKPNKFGGNHENIIGKGSHISWDTDGKGLLVPGTGHTNIHIPRGPFAPRIIKPWD
jgi:hypothetical protein